MGLSIARKSLYRLDKEIGTPPAPVKPDVNLSIHPASCSQLLCVGSSPLLNWLVHNSPFACGLCSGAITAPSSLLRHSPPQCIASGTLAFGFLASAYSRSHRSPVRQRHDWFPSSVQEPTPRSCPLYAGHRLAKSEMTPPGLSQGRDPSLVLMSSLHLSTRHRKVRFRSTPWCLPDRGSPDFSCNAQDHRS